MKNRRSFLAQMSFPFAGRISRLRPSTVAYLGGLFYSSASHATALPQALPSLTLAAAMSGTHDYTFGQVFKRGAVPAGTRLRTTMERSQVDWLQTWSDGSLLQASITVRGPLSPKPRTVEFGIDATPVGNPLTLADLVASRPHAMVGFSGDVETEIKLADLLGQTNDGTWKTPGLVKQRISGPEMSEWKFYSPVRDTHLSVWFTVRLYASGALWVRTTVENGWLKVPAPTSYEYNVILAVGGAVKWFGEIAQPHHARWSLAFWAGTDPEITPTHDKAYLRSTKLVPNYTGGVYPGAGKQGSARIILGALAQSCGPMERANHPASSMGSAGFSEWIGLMPWWDVAFIESDSDERVWRGLIANAEAHSRYSLHYRDETTMLPVRPSMHPDAGFANALHGVDDGGYSNNVKLPTPNGLRPVTNYTTSHAPAPPYLAALMTADDHYAEECSFLLCLIFLGSIGSATPSSPLSGAYGRGLWSLPQPAQVRGYSWLMRSYFMGARVASDAPLRDEWIELLGRALKHTRDHSVDGTTYDGVFKNDLGVFYFGNGDGIKNGVSFQQVWMLQFGVGAYGLGWDLDLPFSPQQRADFQAVRDFVYKLPVGMLGDSSGFCWRRGNAYSTSLGAVTSQSDPQFRRSFAEVWQFHNIGYDNEPLESCQYGDTQLGGDGLVEVPGRSYGESSGTVCLFPAIAYAVDHGAPGALESYRRLTGSSSFTKRNGGRYYWDSGYSLWSILPRSA